MSDLVENLLELARLQSGGIRLRLDWHSVEDLCASAMRHRQVFLAGRPIDLDLDQASSLVRCDGVLVERVLVNLLDNAHRHASGSGALLIWAMVRDGMFQIGLDDDGKNAEAFVKERGSDAGRKGIGLSLCEAIADSHGGSLEIGKAPNGGARVSLRLPQSETPPEVPPEEEA